MKKEDFGVITEFDKRYFNNGEDRYHLHTINYVEDGDNIIMPKSDFDKIIDDRFFLFHEALKLRKIQRFFTEQ